jgi:predicted amidophosphoribosyltransferase
MGGNICPDCHEKIDNDFFTIKEYLYDHPGNYDIDSICQATGVSKKIALHLLEEDRLVVTVTAGGRSDGFMGQLTCSVCKKPINHGTMCEDCKLDLSRKLGKDNPPKAKAVARPVYDADGPRMHIRTSRDKYDK